MTPTPRPTHRRLSPRQPVRRSAAAILLALVGATACAPAGGNDVDRATALVRTHHPDITVTVPPSGAGSATATSITRLPNPLQVHVGQTLRIRNEGVTAVQVGPFLVDGHSTVTQRFLRPGKLEGTCLAHPDGRLVIDVRA